MHSEQIEIFAHWAPDDLKKSSDYYNGRESVLASYGFVSVVKSDVSWMKNTKVIVITAYYKKEVVAGMKVHLRGEDPLPLENSLKNQCDNLRVFLDDIGGNNYAEIGGVWNSKKFAGLKFPHILARYSLALCKHLGLKTVFTFNASYTYKLSKNYGATLLTSLGNNGWFNYPTPKYKAAIWMFEDVQKLNCIYAEDQIRIDQLHIDPNEKLVLEKELPEIKINYNATIS